MSSYINQLTQVSYYLELSKAGFLQAQALQSWLSCQEKNDMKFLSYPNKYDFIIFYIITLISQAEKKYLSIQAE